MVDIVTGQFLKKLRRLNMTVKSRLNTDHLTCLLWIDSVELSHSAELCDILGKPELGAIKRIKDAERSMKWLCKLERNQFGKILSIFSIQ